MECNKNGDCLKLYKNTYPIIKEEINTSSKSIVKQINEIITTLDSLEIPEDYLGTKVKEELEKINKTFEEDEDKLKLECKKVGTFIDEKIEEHKKHYESWILEQEYLAKKNENTNSTEHVTSNTNVDTSNIVNFKKNNKVDGLVKNLVN